MTTTFQQARKRHNAVADAAEYDVAIAGDLWAAIADLGEPPAGSYAEAVRDTAPADHATLLATNDVAKAFAFAGHWETARTFAARAAAATAYGGAKVTPLKMRDAARAAWKVLEERATQTQELARGFGWDLSQAWTTLEDVALRQDDFSAIERVAKLAGRMYAAMRGNAAHRVHGVPEEVYSIELGNSVPRLLGSELAQLANPAFRTLALMRIVEKKALQYAVRGTGKCSKGPLVLALDESGSMHDQRREWSKAAAVALMRVAFDEKRPVVVVHYSSSIVVRPIKPGDAKGVVDMIRHFLNGGTKIGMALHAAAEEIEALAKKGQGGGDVVLVTDGVDGDTASQEAAVAELKKLGARLWTVAIECDIPTGCVLRDAAAHYLCLGGASLDDPKSAIALQGAATGGK